MSYISTNHISLDIYNNSIVCINAKQFDTNARNVEITCTENGKKIVLQKDEVKAYITCQKPDGGNIFNECTVLGNGNVLVELTQQILSTVGRCKIDLILADATGTININKDNELIIMNASVLSTMQFFVNVLPSSVDHSKIESSNEYNALLNAVSRNIALEKELQENENGIIDENGYVIQDGRVQTEQKRVQAENIREQQEAKRIQTFNTNEENRKNTFDTNEKKRQDTFTSNENQRQSTFSTNETNRQNTFEDNEEERNSTFTSNEQQRSTTFINSETDRSNKFTSNEFERQSTFETNETSRTNEFNTEMDTWNQSVESTIQDSVNAETERSETFTHSMGVWTENVTNAITTCNDSVTSKINEFSEQVNDLTESCNAAEANRANAEQSRVAAESNREKITSEAISKCDTATSNANTATGRANRAANSCEDIIETGVVIKSEKGVPEGVATLDEDGKVPNAQINTEFEMQEQSVITSGDSLDVILGKIAAYMEAFDELKKTLE